MEAIEPTTLNTGPRQDLVDTVFAWNCVWMSIPQTASMYISEPCTIEIVYKFRWVFCRSLDQTLNLMLPKDLGAGGHVKLVLHQTVSDSSGQFVLSVWILRRNVGCFWDHGDQSTNLTTQQCDWVPGYPDNLFVEEQKDWYQVSTPERKRKHRMFAYVLPS